MSKLLRILPALTLLLAVAAPDARAQFDLGARAGFDLDVEDAFIGAEARLQSNRFPVVFNPSFDYFLVDSDLDEAVEGTSADSRLMTFGANLLYPFGVDNQLFTPYAGAGLNVAHAAVEVEGNGTEVSDSDVSLGMNLIGGAVFGGGQFRPYAQARITTLTDRDFLSLTGGVLIRLGV